MHGLLVAATEATFFGPVEVLVNNAGIGMGEVRAGDRYTKRIHLFEVRPKHLQRFFAVHALRPVPAHPSDRSGDGRAGLPGGSSPSRPASRR